MIYIVVCGDWDLSHNELVTEDYEEALNLILARRRYYGREVPDGYWDAMDDFDCIEIWENGKLIIMYGNKADHIVDCYARKITYEELDEDINRVLKETK